MQATAALDALPIPSFDDTPDDWPDYAALLGDVSAADLERVAADVPRHMAGPPAAGDLNPHFAPVHAWRALAQRGEADRLVRVMFEADDAAYDSDWYLEDLPRAATAVGTNIVPVLERFLAGEGQTEDAYASAIEVLKLVGGAEPGTRDACVRILAAQLAAGHSAAVNAFVVLALVDLEAVEAAEAIGEAYREGRVEPSIAGDWTMTQMDLGLLPYDPDYRPAGATGDYMGPSDRAIRAHAPKAGAKAKAKAKKKAAKASRKKNRK